MPSQLVVADCVLHRLSLSIKGFLNMRIQHQLKDVLICFIEFTPKEITEKIGEHRVTLKNYILQK